MITHGDVQRVIDAFILEEKVSFPSVVPRLLDCMPRRRRPSSRPTRFRQNGRGIMSVLDKAAKIGYKLGSDKRYKRMGAKGATGYYRRLPRPWER